RHDRRARHRLLPEARAHRAAHFRRRGLAPRPDGAAGRVLILRRFVAGLVLLAACSRPPELVRRPEHPPPALLIRDVPVLDVEAGTLVPHRDVLLVGDRVSRVAAAGTVSPPPGAATIAGGGATLLPGLIDMHGHVGGNPAPPWRGGLPDLDANLRAYLHCGATTSPTRRRASAARCSRPWWTRRAAAACGPWRTSARSRTRSTPRAPAWPPGCTASTRSASRTRPSPSSPPSASRWWQPRSCSRA